MLNETPQPLLQPHRLSDLLLTNRVVMVSLTHGRANNSGHVPNDLGISRDHASELVAAGLGDFVAFGRKYIANPDLVERIRLRAPLDEQRPEGYYGATGFGYTDYPFLAVAKNVHAGVEGALSR